MKYEIIFKSGKIKNIISKDASKIKNYITESFNKIQSVKVLNEEADFPRLSEEAYSKILSIIHPTKKSFGGIIRFNNLTVEQLEEISKVEGVDLYDKQNEAPTLKQFLEFGENVTRFSLLNLDGELYYEGYLVDADRNDSRITIDGIAIKNVSVKEDPEDLDELKSDFKRFARKADELDIEDNYMRAWWD